MRHISEACISSGEHVVNAFDRQKLEVKAAVCEFANLDLEAAGVPPSLSYSASSSAAASAAAAKAVSQNPQVRFPQLNSFIILYMLSLVHCNLQHPLLCFCARKLLQD